MKFSSLLELILSHNPNQLPIVADHECSYFHEECLANWPPRDKWAYCNDLEMLLNKIIPTFSRECINVGSRLTDLRKSELDQLDLIVKPTEPLQGRNRNQVFEPAHTHGAILRASRAVDNIASRLDYTTIDKEKLRNHQRPRINLIEEYQMVATHTHQRVEEIASAIRKVIAELRSCPDDHLNPSFWMSLRASLVSMSMEYPSLDLPSSGEFLSGEEEFVKINMQLLGMQAAITAILTAAYNQGDRLFSGSNHPEVISADI